MYDGTGQRTRDAFDCLDARHNKFAEVVDVRRPGAHDHVVRTGYIFGRVDAFDLAHFLSHLRGLSYFCLDEDVGLYISQRELPS